MFLNEKGEIGTMVNVLSGNNWREGRGFSLTELEAAGIKSFQARKMGLRLDLRRRTSHELNVEELKKMAAQGIPSAPLKIERPKLEKKPAAIEESKSKPIAAKRKGTKTRDKGAIASEGKKRGSVKSKGTPES